MENNAVYTDENKNLYVLNKFGFRRYVGQTELENMVDEKTVFTSENAKAETAEKGEKYNPEMDITEIAKAVRNDLRHLKNQGVEVSVRSERYSGGRALHVNLTPRKNFGLYTEGFEIALKNGNNTEYLINGGQKYTEAAEKVLTEAENVVNAYRYDNSDSQTDYFETNFYPHVQFDFRYESDIKDSIKGEK